MLRKVPGLHVLSSYHRSWLPKDIIAGVVLSTLLVPQGMAYAELAGLPPITGLYTSILCLLGYAAFGPSRILVLGPDSSLGPMIAATILPLVAAQGDAERAIALASMLAIMVGVIMIVGAVAKIGFIADLISKPTMIGYMNGLTLTILVGQLPKLFGFKVEAEGFAGEVTGFVHGLVHGEAIAAAAATGIAGIAVIMVLQRWLPKVPAVLIMVVAAIAAASIFNLADHGVSLVGVLPKGFPPLTIPHIHVSDLGLLFAGAPGIALVSLTDTISTASAFAARTGQQVRGNQEILGIAVAVGLSILNVFRRAWWPYDTVLGRVEGLAGYHDVHTHPEAEHLPGLTIYRFDAPLFFANAKTFRDEVRHLAGAEPKPRWILIAAEPVTDVDTTASDVLEDLDEALNAEGISLIFAELKDPVRDKIERYGLTRTIDPRHFFPTIEAAVTAFRLQTGAEWTGGDQNSADQMAKDPPPPESTRRG